MLQGALRNSPRAPWGYLTESNMPRYHIWTVGCDVNKADGQAGHRPPPPRLAGDSPTRGAPTSSCSTPVASAEGRGASGGELGSLRRLKAQRDGGSKIAVIGSMVGLRASGFRSASLSSTVSRDHRPSPTCSPRPAGGGPGRRRSGPAPSPADGAHRFVPVVHGSDSSAPLSSLHRGRGAGRPSPRWRSEVAMLAERGARRTAGVCPRGHASWGRRSRPIAAAFPNAPTWPTCSTPSTTRPASSDSLPHLLPQGHDRRYHPLRGRHLPKVCEYFNIPVQSGDDAVLARMRRGSSPRRVPLGGGRGPPLSARHRRARRRHRRLLRRDRGPVPPHLRPPGGATLRQGARHRLLAATGPVASRTMPDDVPRR